MRNQRLFSSLWLGVGLSVIPAVGGHALEDSPQVRPAYCAGGWYPKDADALAKQLDGLLDKAAAPSTSQEPIGLISPHAGYRYSAPVAAAAYRGIRGHPYERVIVMAFSHRNASRYGGIDVPKDLRAYQTPLGEIPLDREVCDALLENPLFSSQGEIDVGEHSLELQLPFLQRSLKAFRLVPLLVGRMDAASYAKAASALLPWIDDKTLLVASTDFTHYGERFGYLPFTEELPRKLSELADQAAAPLLRGDFDGFRNHVDQTGDTICGRGPVSLLLRILSMSGGAVGVRAGFDTSGNLTGDWSSSVTYQSFVFSRPTGTLAASDRASLLKLARETVGHHLSGKGVAQVKAARLSPGLLADGACFVTLENKGQLRGCIGNMVANGPLYEAVVRNAISACGDRRFLDNPVTAAELGQLDIEISYLTPMKRVKEVDEIIIGRHGLMITLGWRRGVLLPQVAARRGWTREEFLAQTCRKAGLAIDAWKTPEAQLYSIEAEVFGEAEMKHDSPAKVP